MEEIIGKIKQIQEEIEYAKENISYANELLENIYYGDEISEYLEKGIKDIDNFKQQMKKDGIWSKEIEDFIENYMKYYNE